MSVESFFDRTATISRLGSASGGKRSFGSVASAVPYHRQELGEDRRRLLDMLEGNAFTGYFSKDANIRMGDYITDEDDGLRCEVKEVRRKDYAFAINKHLEVTLLEINPVS